MDYNTTRNTLITKEFGRNLQKIVDKLILIRDRNKRNDYARLVIKVMMQMYPGPKESEDYHHKLWDLLFLISDFRLDVDSPFPKPNPEEVFAPPSRIEYTKNQITYRHYGKNIEAMIKKISDLPEGEEKIQLMTSVGNFLKQSFLTWNRDSVSDKQIFDDFKYLSDNKITPGREIRLFNTKEYLDTEKAKEEEKLSKRKNQGKQNHKNTKMLRTKPRFGKR